MKALKILGIVVGAFMLVGVAGFLLMNSAAQKDLKTLVYESIDMNTVADGMYTGEAEAGLVAVRVGVNVSDHAIADIVILEHQTGLGHKAESITKEMLSANTYDVDAISGATISSEAFKSAVSKALSQGIV